MWGMQVVEIVKYCAKVWKLQKKIPKSPSPIYFYSTYEIHIVYRTCKIFHKSEFLYISICAQYIHVCAHFSQYIYVFAHFAVLFYMRSTFMCVRAFIDFSKLSLRAARRRCRPRPLRRSLYSFVFYKTVLFPIYIFRLCENFASFFWNFLYSRFLYIFGLRKILLSCLSITVVLYPPVLNGN